MVFRGWQSVNTRWLVSKHNVSGNAGVFHTVFIKLLSLIHHSSYIQFFNFLKSPKSTGLYGKRATVNVRYFPWGITREGIARGSRELSTVGWGLPENEVGRRRDGEASFMGVTVTSLLTLDSPVHFPNALGSIRGQAGSPRRSCSWEGCDSQPCSLPRRNKPSDTFQDRNWLTYTQVSPSGANTHTYTIHSHTVRSTRNWNSWLCSAAYWWANNDLDVACWVGLKGGGVCIVQCPNFRP